MAKPYDIDAVCKEWLGKKAKTLYAKYPVEYEPIRRHCQMVGNNNPLFLDPDYGAASRYESVICPPVAIQIFALPGRLPPDPNPRSQVIDLGLPLPGSNFTNMSREQQFFTPVKVGDQLNTTTHIAELFIKATRLDPKSVWIISEDVIKNQRDEVVCIVRNTLLNFRTEEEQQSQEVS